MADVSRFDFKKWIIGNLNIPFLFLRHLRIFRSSVFHAHLYSLDKNIHNNHALIHYIQNRYTLFFHIHHIPDKLFLHILCLHIQDKDYPKNNS